MSWAAVASAAVGAGVGLLGSKGSKGGNVASSASSDPWLPSQPYIGTGYKAAADLLGRGAPNLASPVTQEAKNLAGSTLRGDFLNSNPFTQGAVQDAMGMARSQINSQFGGQGGNNFGSSAHQEWLGRGLMNASLPYLSQNYENERGRQFAALSQAPALAGLDYQQAFAPWDFLGRYSQTISGLTPGMGGTQTTQTPYFTNPVNSALGGALLGNQLYNQYKQPSQSNAWGNWMNMGSSTPFSQSGFADF